MADKHPLSDTQITELTPLVEDAFSSLADGARSGDTSARKEMIGACREYLLFIANQELEPELRPKCGASDVVQNTMVQAVANFEAFDGQNKLALLGWLRRILLNELGAVRRQFLVAEKRDLRREFTTERVPNFHADHLGLVDPQMTPATEASALEDAERLRQALLTLSDDHQQVLRLRNWERMPFAAIGNKMERSEDAAKKLWARALASLNESLANGEPGTSVS